MLDSSTWISNNKHKINSEKKGSVQNPELEAAKVRAEKEKVRLEMEEAKRKAAEAEKA